VRAVEILQEHFEAELRRFHLARVRVFFAAVMALFRSGRLSLTALGRAIADQTTHKHGIKRVDRLLGNVALQSAEAQRSFYAAIAKRLVRRDSRPVVLVDWTAVTPKLWALTAAIPLRGRALIIYAETHPTSRYAKPSVNAEFLRGLRAVLPRCKPVIVADAGFRTPFMKLVLALGWDYVVRVRSVRRHTLVLLLAARRWIGDVRGEARWKGLDSYYPLATRVPRDIGRYLVGRKVQHECRIIAVRKSAQRVTRGLPRVTGEAEKMRRSAKEPWMLATSLARTSPKKIARVYGQRMQIEETFRDAKSPRFGFALSYARTSSPERANVLLLLCAFAHLLSVLVGLAAEKLGLARHFQANTTSRRRRVNSLATLGRYVLQLHNLLAIAPTNLSWNSLRTSAQTL
jgi:hypothetical protein